MPVERSIAFVVEHHGSGGPMCPDNSGKLSLKLKDGAVFLSVRIGKETWNQRMSENDTRDLLVFAKEADKTAKSGSRESAVEGDGEGDGEMIDDNLNAKGPLRYAGDAAKRTATLASEMVKVHACHQAVGHDRTALIVKAMDGDGDKWTVTAIKDSEELKPWAA